MSRRPLRTLLALAAGIATLAPMTAPRHAAAQSSYSAIITAINPSAFPEITATVSISDTTTGLRIPGLGKSDFALLENGEDVNIEEIREEDVGLQLAFVIDSSSAFSKRDADTFTRLDHVKTSIINFAVGEGESGNAYMKDVVDTVNIFAPEGIVAQNSSIGGEIRDALIAYQSDFLEDTGLFGLIAQALDSVSASTAQPGMRREVIIFTSGIDASADAQVSALAQRAVAGNIVVHTVLIGPAASVSQPIAENVKALSSLTGGAFVYFEGPASTNALWGAIITQRAQYRLVYRSGVRQSGQHTLQLLANIRGLSLLSGAESFSLAIQPPLITVTNAPVEIVRATDERGANPASIEPREQVISVAIESPDGYPRNIAKLQLIVDNTIADEITAGPFDTLHWDLSGYSETAAHGMQALVIDELGLEGRSEIANVLVTVDVPPPLIATAGPVVLGVSVAVIAGVAVLALVVAVVVLFLRRPTIITNIVREASGRVKEMTEPFIPTPHHGAAKNRPGKAYLDRIDDTVPGPHPAIELISDNLRLGRDETLAQIAFNDKSVSRLHARITEEADGVFFIPDEGSTSGTWVNYHQVSLSGQQLRHGDVINLGRVQLRFSLRTKTSPPPSPIPAPTPAASAQTAPAYSTEPFDAAMIRTAQEKTEQGVHSQVKNRDKDNDAEFHTEAFTPRFDSDPDS